MRKLRNLSGVSACKATLKLALSIGFGLLGAVAFAQPANDNFAAAEVLDVSALHGTASADTTAATQETGEPSHAGYPPQFTVWYQWTAPETGEVAFNTFGSDYQTILAVYTGNNLPNLIQVAANDGANIGASSAYAPYLGSSAGPCLLRFNAIAGQTYYVVVGGAGGNLMLNWAYNPSGVFRFATQVFDFVTGSPMYECLETESFFPQDPSAAEHNVPGVLVTVTRVGGTSGRILVDYQTADGTAIAMGTEPGDYFAASGTLEFREFEMSKSIVLYVFPRSVDAADDQDRTPLERDFSITLSNPRLDALESTEVAPPMVDPLYGSALVRIYDTGVDPVLIRNFDTNGAWAGPTNAVFNAEKLHYQFAEDVTNRWVECVIQVCRSGGTDGTKTVHYQAIGAPYWEDNGRNNAFFLQPGSDYATPTPEDKGGIRGRGSDFSPDNISGTITWGDNDYDCREIVFYIHEDQITEFNEDFVIQLWGEDDGRRFPLGTANLVYVTILWNDDVLSAGSVDQYHNPDYAVDMSPPVNTVPPSMAHPGADGVVFDLAVQTDDKSIVVGDFRSFNTVPRNRIARMNVDGSLDLSFNPGDGANGFISSIALTPGGQVVIGGAFSFFNGAQRNSIARLNSDGSVDSSFNPGTGANGTVWDVAVQSDGKVVIVGEFSSINGVPRTRVARLNEDGSLDTTFDPGVNGPNGTVNAVALTASGQIVIGGEFTALGSSAHNNLARLNPNGSIDNLFRFGLGLGVSGPVFALAVQTDGRLLVGGEFSHINVTPRTRIARLNTNGTVDSSFDPGIGANDTVYSINPQPGRIYVGGLFTSFNGTHRLAFARLYTDGTVDTTFLDTAYNQFAGLPRRYYNPAVTPKPFVWASGVQTDGNVMIGGGFDQVGGGQRDLRIQPEDIAGDGDFFTRAGIRNRNNVARLIGGETPGPGNISLWYPSYSVNQEQGALYVSLMRTNGALGFLSANFSVQPGLAESGTDYLYNSIPPVYLGSWGSSRMVSDGFFGTNTILMDIYDRYWAYDPDSRVTVTILNPHIAGNRFSTFQLANPLNVDHFYLGGENIPIAGALGRSVADFTIVDDNTSPGTLGFALSSYTVSEGTNAVITLSRTNGSYGSVSVQFATANGTALAGTDYFATNGTITFSAGQTNKAFAVRLINNSIVQPVDRTINLRLYNPNSATLGLSNAVLSVVDDDYPPGFVNFTAASYSTNESAGTVVLTITRTGGNKGSLTVRCGTTNGSAISGTHYLGQTNTFVWNDGDATPQYFEVPLLDNGTVAASTFFTAFFFDARVNTAPAPTVLGGALTRATVNIVEDDGYGTVEFSAPTYRVNENGGLATITVTRRLGSAETVRVNYATGDGSAVSSGILPNFVQTAGSLTFGPGEAAKSFNVPLLHDGLPNSEPFFFTVQLSDADPAGTMGSLSNAIVNIVDTESYNEPAGSVDPLFDPAPGFNADIYSLALQPDGKILAAGAFTRVNSFTRSRVARLNADASLDTSFLNGLNGANGQVISMLLQSDGRILLGGEFTSVNGIARNRLARLVADGNLDTSFDIGSGADDTIFAFAETFSGSGRSILVGGSFTRVNGIPRAGLARLSNNGDVDGSFNPALIIDGTVYAIAVYPTNTIQAGKIIIAGDFTSVEGFARHGIARLNPNGTLDPTFNPGTGADGVVRALALQLDGRIVVGGAFTNFNGQLLQGFARLNVNGTIDSSFQVGQGATDTVEGIAIQPDNRIILVGQFTAASGLSRRRITRLLPDGTPDPALNFGTGADGFISSVVLQPDGKIIVGGGFSEFDGSQRERLARVYGGSLTGAGTIEFTGSDFFVEESSTNAVVTLRRRGGTVGSISVDFATMALTAVPGVNYSNVSTTITFPAGETFQSVIIPVLDDLLITPDLTVYMTLENVSPPAAIGNQPFATLTIVNTDSTVNFSSATYRVNEDLVGGVANIELVRNGSTAGTASVDFITTTNGTAFANTNYIAVSNTVVFLPGRSNVIVQVPVLHNPIPEGNKTVEITLTNALNTVLFDPSTAILTIQDVDTAPGQLYFSATNYVAVEGSGHLPVTILRTNGSSGIVSVSFATIPGTAIPNVKYASTNGILTFGDGELSKTFTIPMLDDSVVGGSTTLSVRLSNATGGATILPPNVMPVTILDNDLGITFSSAAYVVPETDGSIFLTVYRTNGITGVTTVNYATTNITALAGTNYVPLAGTLTFTNGESIKTFAVQILDDPRVTGNLSFGVSLSNPSVPAQLLEPSTTVVNITDSDPGFTFVATNSFVFEDESFNLVTNAAYAAVKSGTNVLITVLRSNANTGVVSVNYATSNRTAQAGIDYITVSGTLTFSNGVSLQSFSVPIINNRLVQGDRTFDINLFNPSPGAQLVPPSTATVVITDDISGLSFSAPSYSIAENGVAATITVLRSNFTNSTVSVSYSTTNGTARAGVHYVPANGILTFTNGETVKTFTVPVIDNTVVDGDHTALLTLSQPVGNALLVEPSGAALNILEAGGSLIVQAGSAIQSESGPVNGVIDPGETVTVLLSLRNASGTNTQNLVATLLPTPGVTSPSGPQSYGTLEVRGASAFRPFTFTADGTNGQPLNVTLQLNDNGTSLSNIVYALSIGNIPSAWSNSSAIFINDFAAATPYPSIINVSGLAGAVNKATVTITNFNHSWPRDVSVMLVSPGGQRSYLMAKSGGSVAANNITLNFDDATNAVLPYSSQLISGTYRPTSHATASPPFPVPAPPPPYNTNMSAFNGSNPNGNWALYVYDDKGWDWGAISNGWVLRLNTGAPAAADVGVAVSAVDNTVVAGSNLTFTVTVVNYGPAGASNIVVTDVLPAAYVGNTRSQGSASTNGSGLLTWNVGSLGTNASATMNLVVRPSTPGVYTNVASVVSSSTDLNLDNNSASATALAVVPTADLVLGLAGAPNPIVAGDLVTYTISVTNFGPATAPSLRITDTLPSGFSFVSSTPGGAIVSGRTVSFANLGDLSSGGRMSVSVIAKANAAGTFTNSASCNALVTDPLKGNNSAAVKTDVISLTLSVVRVGNNLVFSWPADANMSLYNTTSLVPPVAWGLVTSPPPVLIGDQMTVTIPIGTGSMFFRLAGTAQ